MAKRAHAPEDRLSRRRVILEAAADLFVTGSGELPAVAEIAATAGLAKGTVYLYFRTKEAIFSALLLEGWGEVLDGLGGTIGSGGRTRADRVARFVAGLVGHIERHPELLRLDALGHGVVERNLEPETLLAYKRALTDRLEAGGAVVEEALDLPRGRGQQLLTRTYAMTRGLWQSFDELSRPAHPAPPGACPADFGSELAEALAEYWRGALADG